MRLIVVPALLASIALTARPNAGRVPGAEPHVQAPPVAADEQALLREMLGDGVLTQEERASLATAGVPQQRIDHIASQMRKRHLGPPPDQGPYLRVPLRSPMTHDELQHLLLLIEPSGAQRQFIESAFAHYFDDIAQTWLARTGEVWQAAADAAASQRSDEGPMLVARAFREAERVDRGIAARENAFLESLRPALAESQWPGLERARLLRDRMACNPDDSWHAGANVDLSRMLLELRTEQPDAFTITPELSEVLSDYERRLTLLLLDLRRVSNDAEVARVANLASTRLAGNDVAERFRLLEERKQFSLPAIRIGRSIHDLNASTLDALLAMLAVSVGADLRDRFLTKAYPVAYPFDRRAVVCVDVAISDPAAHAVLGILAACREELLRDLDESAALMAQTFTQWKVEVAETGGFSHERYLHYQQEMLRLLKQQNDASNRALDLVQSTLPHLKSVVSEHRAAIDSDFAARSNLRGGRGFGWPDPYGDFETP